MKAITIKQPFATLIAEGLKEYEFRTWNTKYRGEVLIHAGKGIDKKAMKRFEHLNLEYPAGCIIAKATITDCVFVDNNLKNEFKKKNDLVYYGILNSDSNWKGYGFKLENITKLNAPIEAKGKLSFWNYYSNDEIRDSIKKVFDITALKYDERFGNDWENKYELDEFIRSMKKGANVLDIGSGTGYLSSYLAQNGLKPIGIDFSDSMIEIANKKYSKIDFIKLDMTNLESKFKNDTFDGAIAFYSLFYLPKAQLNMVLKSISNILKKDGKMLLVMQEGNKELYTDECLMPDGKGEKILFASLYKDKELTSILAKNNFEILSFKYKQNSDPDEVSDERKFIILVRNNKHYK